MCVRALTHECFKRIQHSQAHNIPHVSCPAGRVATGGNKDTASSYKDFIPVNQNRNPEKAIIVTSSAVNTCCSPAAGCVSLPLFSLIQNGFLLITIIPKVLKHINRWVSPAYKGPAGWLLWPCPTAADTSFSDKSNLAVTRGLASLEKILRLIWHSEVSKCSTAILLQRLFCCHMWMSTPVSHLLHSYLPESDSGGGGENNLNPE